MIFRLPFSLTYPTSWCFISPCNIFFLCLWVYKIVTICNHSRWMIIFVRYYRIRRVIVLICWHFDVIFISGVSGFIGIYLFRKKYPLVLLHHRKCLYFLPESSYLKLSKYLVFFLISNYFTKKLDYVIFRGENCCIYYLNLSILKNGKYVLLYIYIWEIINLLYFI